MYFIRMFHFVQQRLKYRDVARSGIIFPIKKTEQSRSFLWSGRRGSNSRHLPWQGSILPLNYSRIFSSPYYNTISKKIIKQKFLKPISECISHKQLLKMNFLPFFSFYKSARRHVVKKCAIILGFILLCQGMVFARIHESYSIYQSRDCYRHGHYTYCRPHRMNGHTHYRIYYPQTGVSVNLGGNYRYNSMSPVMRGLYYPPRRHGGNVSVHVSI